MTHTTYVLAGGCFWCLEAVFVRLKGVVSALPGYTGGSAETAHYSQVATGTTAHAEAVQVSFDEQVLPREVLLDIFFLIHDPTSPNQQGADIGPQYRSAMFYADEAQKQSFEQAVIRAQNNWDKPIVTTVEPLRQFYEAEPEHHDYFSNNPTNPYCSVVISPKVTKARQAFSQYIAK